MSKFKRLTDAEARTLTRAELLDRVEAEQAYWLSKRTMTDADLAAEREFSRIWHIHLSPEAAIQAAMDTAQGRRSDYWETRPCDDKPKAYAEQHPVLCAHADQDGTGAHWLAPGKKCPETRQDERNIGEINADRGHEAEAE